jgi:glucosamine-6-phosphate deaminase
MKSMAETFTADRARVTIFPTADALGLAAADDLAAILQREVAARGEAAVILATGNSQLPFMRALCERVDLPWDRVTILHMDEYLGMGPEHPASFRRYIQTHLVDVVRPRAFLGMAGDALDVDAEIRRYTALLDEHRPIACVLGIGENGHLAFNDPPADFDAGSAVHVVALDEACRRQQVGEGHFPDLEAVPRQALSLTIPALLRPANVLAVVPEDRKAQAVRAALEGPVTPECPASILRTHAHVRLYLDQASASLLRQRSQK